VLFNTYVWDLLKKKKETDSKIENSTAVARIRGLGSRDRKWTDVGQR
jgi:hypothetical protein